MTHSTDPGLSDRSPAPTLLDLFAHRRLALYCGVTLAWTALTFWVTYEPGSELAWIDGWYRWDAQGYWRIWNEGYGTEFATLAYMPLFSWVAGAFSRLTFTSFTEASLVINWTSFLLGGVLAAEFLRRRFAVPGWPIFLTHICCPAAFYAFVPYSDSFFYLLFWLALWVADRPYGALSTGQRVTAWSLFAIIPATRLNGFALLVLVLFRRWYALAVLGVLIAILTYNLYVTGDPLFFLHMQAGFRMPEGWFLDGFLRHWKELPRPPLDPVNRLSWLQSTVLPLFSMLLVFIAAIWLSLRREWMFAATMVVFALFSRNQAHWRSVFRYDLPLNPLLILPWVHWFSDSKATSGLKKHLIWGVAGSFIVVFLAVGLAIQLGIARRLHIGGWGF